MEWMQEHHWIPEDNFVTGEPGPRPIDLIEYQQDALREAFRKDENDNYIYSTVVWSDIKKSGKSTICAGVALYMADIRDWAENYLVANDLKQADSRVGKYARRSVLYSPYLSKNYKTVRNNIIGIYNHSMIEALPIDPSGEAGSNADFIQFSELWGAIEDAKERMFVEMAPSPTKFGKSLVWIESYAGYKEESEVLYNLWEVGVENGELLWPDRLYPVTNGEPAPLELYVNRDARQLTLWNTKPRCPWQTVEYYASEEERLRHNPSEFLRMHRNQWIQQTETFVPIEWWDACAFEVTEEEKFPVPLPDQALVAAMDAAVSDDTFGLLMAGKHPLAYSDNEEIALKWRDITVPYYAKKWSPKLEVGGKVDFQGTEENPGPERELIRLSKKHNIVQVAYDAYQLHDMATRLKKDHPIWFKDFSQAGDRLVADSELRDKIRDRRILHNGNVDLREHIQNADAKVDIEDRKVRIVKRTKKLKIDLAVCLSMASHEVHRLNL